jgi:lysyl-tRNA synthetase class II
LIRRTGATVAALALCLGAADGRAQPVNDYPTVARADYVMGCMVSNGYTREALEACSCSIDHIATVLPYEAYVEAETVLALRRMSGEKTAPYRTAATFKAVVENLRRAQVEADILCFLTSAGDDGPGG